MGRTLPQDKQLKTRLESAAKAACAGLVSPPSLRRPFLAATFTFIEPALTVPDALLAACAPATVCAAAWAASDGAAATLRASRFASAGVGAAAAAAGFDREVGAVMASKRALVAAVLCLAGTKPEPTLAERAASA